jgi:hypothetical protein
MEPRFGHNFSQVRIHDDAEAAKSAREVNARAYTVGTHTVFGAGQYAPDSFAGQQLIAHELAHVVQQSNGTTLHLLQAGGVAEGRTELAAERVHQQRTTKVDTHERKHTGSRKANPKHFPRIPIEHDLPAGSLRATPLVPWPIQTKLAVEEVDDPREREADRIADRVMKMSGPGISTTDAATQVGHKCARSKEEEALGLRAKTEFSFAREVVRQPGQPPDRTSILPARVIAGSQMSDVGVLPDDPGNEFGDTGGEPAGPATAAPVAPASNPAQSPAPAPATGCGCCVDKVSIGNIKPFDNPKMGHSYDLKVSMSYPAVLRAPGSGHCTLQWFERTNVPYAAGMVANAWNDMFALIPNSVTFSPWHHRNETCGSGQPVTITDLPALGKPPGRTVTRILDFDIVVSSSSTGCGNASAHATATQKLVMVNGAADWASSSFVPT